MRITPEKFIENNLGNRFCKLILDEEGMVLYAIPSHLGAIMKENNITIEEVNSALEDGESPLLWIIRKTGYVCVYDSFYMAPHKMNEKQTRAIELLIENNLTTKVKIKAKK